jgi:hypothetical protein
MRFCCAVIALSLLVAFATDSRGQSKRPPPDRNQTQRADQPPATDQRGTSQSPAIVKILPPEDADAKAKQEADDRAAKDRLDTNTIRLGIAAILVALLQFVGIGIQAVYLRKTVKVSEAVARAAQASAEAVVSQLRAYLAFEPIGIESLGPGKVVKFKFNISNVGSTPAYEVYYQAVIRILPHPLPENYPFPEMDDRIPSVITIFKDVVFPCKFPSHMALEADDVAIVARGEEERLYLIGIIHYRDAFKRPRYTKFCISVAGPIPETSADSQVNFFFSNQHNDAD